MKSCLACRTRSNPLLPATTLVLLVWVFFQLSFDVHRFVASFASFASFAVPESDLSSRESPTHILDSGVASESRHTPPTSHLGKRNVIWSQARRDRSGAFIQDMLMCHAYAYQNNYVYGGACWRDTRLRHKSANKKLINDMGLSNVLKFRCPDANVTLLNSSVYRNGDTAIFTEAYVEFIRSLIKYPSRKPQRRRISVHIRRGDVTPCNSIVEKRYLPNQHFLRLINRYNPQNDSDVVVYSQSKSFETFDEFHSHGYQVVLDGSVSEVWKNFLISDVSIMSRSSFSFVPAMLTRGTVVYTKFWHKPLAGWEIVDDSFVNETMTEIQRLKTTC